MPKQKDICWIIFKSNWDMQAILERARKERVDFIIHAGDLCEGPSDVMEVIDLYNGCEIPTYPCLGNHETDTTSYEETLRLYHMEDGHYYFGRNHDHH